MVGEHFHRAEAGFVRTCGTLGRENVGMSNRYLDEKSRPRKSKDSSATQIGGGLGGPKAMAKAAAEGQSVNIPTRHIRNTDGGTREIILIALMVWRPS